MKVPAETIQYTVIVEELTCEVLGSRKLADFTDLVGKWTPDPGFDETIKSQRKTDGTKWCKG